MISNIFGKRVKESRKVIGLSLRNLSSKSEISLKEIKSYEKGELFPSSENLIKLAAALKIPIERLFRPETVKMEIKWKK